VFGKNSSRFKVEGSKLEKQGEEFTTEVTEHRQRAQRRCGDGVGEGMGALNQESRAGWVYVIGRPGSQNGNFALKLSRVEIGCK
jgi:hypothetical protein